MTEPTPGHRRAIEAKLSPQRKAEIQGLVAVLAPTIADFVIAAIAPLKRRIEQLESKPQLRYLGTWKEGQVYGSGSFITDGGSCWYAQRASVGERPGTSDAFVLAVKKGRDSK